jgi:hypothetical protein
MTIRLASLPHDRTRFRLKQLPYSRLLGFFSLAAVLIVEAAVGAVTGRPGWQLLFHAPYAAAITLNVCIWAAAIVFGRTTQFRLSWFFLLAYLFALAALAYLPGHGDLGLVVFWSLIALGYPTSILALHPPLPLLRAPLLPLLPYLQSFVLLPQLFRWRRARGPLADPGSSANLSNGQHHS